MTTAFSSVSEFFTRPLFAVNGTAVSFTSILVFVLLTWLSFFVARQGRKLVQRLVNGRLEATLANILDQLANVAIIVAGLYIALRFVGIDIGGLVVLASALGVGIGFGLQNIASNLISGMIILLERPISVGDRVTVGETVGDVTRIGLRSTEVVTPDNIMIIVPNSEFISNRVTNWTRGRPQTRIHLPVGVAYGSDLEKTRHILLDIARAQKGVLPEPAPEVWLVNFGDSSINLELLVWVEAPNLIPRLRSELNFAVEAALRAHAISIPFPQRDVRVVFDGQSNGSERLGV
ncbi:mechanosensitive ion channel family protein [Gloeobacter kilaueensis]|uniref:Potassium efflux system protein KefA n=1 Tax=Gloeobacter kilaueensis (strain ATCC BAA-2537 / CCAP 1431/1 / ULC 316 / JS1) TaxID=1183438 RepID=U5QFR4_GLOK1|nr:mechanosensitive ion channel domain-containing protein [Gloeobacter kilaueensis]AGY56444.1 potassium efflux system protein KefA [Gloeobacter kilaueensis JS1]